MRFKLSYGWYRFMGITGICLIIYIVVIGIFGKTDISPMLPNEMASNLMKHWPNLPFFKVENEPGPQGKGHETYYTVPTRQLTPEEIAELKATGPEPKSVPVYTAKPKEATKH